ncbi:MAG TPA: hypothetical protein VGC91_08015 [Pyrinomonadaceae bacterium]|jgi:hypothetical protein
MALALALTASIIFGTVACGRAAIQRVKAGTHVVVVQLELNAGLPDQLYAQHLISADVRDHMKLEMTDLHTVAQGFEHDLGVALDTMNPASIAALAPVLANLITRINALNIAGVNHPGLSQMLQLIAIGLNVVSVWYATQLNRAVRKVSANHSVTRDKIEFALAGVPYDAERMRAARAAFKAGGEHADLRAVSVYTGVDLDAGVVSTIRESARRAVSTDAAYVNAQASE